MVSLIIEGAYNRRGGNQTGGQASFSGSLKKNFYCSFMKYKIVQFSVFANTKKIPLKSWSLWAVSSQTKIGCIYLGQGLSWEQYRWSNLTDLPTTSATTSATTSQTIKKLVKNF